MDRETKYIPKEQLFNGVTTQVHSATDVYCEPFRNQQITVVAAGGTATVLTKATTSRDSVDFSSASTATNPWFYADVKIQGDAGSITAAATGVVFSGAGTKSYEINTNGITQFALEISAISGATVTAHALLTNNG